MALSGNGTRLLMGGYQDDDRQGAARGHSTVTSCGWLQQGAKVVGTGGTSAAGVAGLLGVAERRRGIPPRWVATADDDLAGAAWVYHTVQAGSAWTQQARLVGATQAAGAARQGNSVSLSADGSALNAQVGCSGDGSNQGRRVGLQDG
jgi:hypothetical protein